MLPIIINWYPDTYRQLISERYNLELSENVPVLKEPMFYVFLNI